MAEQDGLEWVSKTFGLEPHWTKEPDMNIISKIARKHLGHDEDVQVTVNFHAQGAFNKLYKISTISSDCLMRVSLPVHPHLKTQSEVATISYVQKETDTPVPRVLAFDSNNKNELGFEWILMEMMPGVPLRKKWRKMSWDAKQDLVRQLVRFQGQLYEKSFPKIGNLFATNEPTSFDVGPIVSLVFFWGNHLKQTVPRGPFDTSYDWLKARLSFALFDQKHVLETTDDEDDIEDAEYAKELAEDVERQLSTVFPPNAVSKHNILFHDDLSMQNILVDEAGQLTAIIDWECVSVVPRWRACQIPQLLEGRTRETEPTRDEYAPESDDDEDQGPDALDNEGIDMNYWEHLLEYEQTQLRKLFKKEMSETNKAWMATMNASTLQADFEKAVHNCDNTWRFRVVREWLDGYKEGTSGNLSAMLVE